MTFKEFDELLQRYLKGECTPEESESIEKWYASYDKEIPDLLPTHYKTVVEERLFQALNKTKTAPVKPKQRFLTMHFLSGIAASILLLILSVWWLNGDGNGKLSKLESVVETETTVVNRTTDVLSHTLTDGSTAILQSGSEIRYYPKHFAKSREVNLIGEAFFEVKKDKQHPFFVYTNELVTKVLGTSFNVSARKDMKEIVVSVKTGRVAVFTKNVSRQKKEIKEVILAPNQKAIYDTFSDKMIVGVVKEVEKAPVEIASKIHFANATVLEIFKVLEDSYGIDIRLEQENLAACKITTTLANESLFEKLDIICQAIGSEYKVVDASALIITGGGCN